MTASVPPFSEIAAAAKAWPGPAWLTGARQAAIERFALAGLPTTRLEAWRTTPLPDFGREAFGPGAPSTGKQSAGVVAPFASKDAVTLVFVDGFHSAALSSPESKWPKGVRLSTLRRLLETAPEEARPWLNLGTAASGALVDLNTAVFEDGAAIIVADGAQVPVEVRVVLAATHGERPVAEHIRHHVHLGRGSSLRLTVAVLGTADALGFINNRTTVTMAERSRLDLVRVHESPLGVPHFDALSATLGADVEFSDTILQTGPSWTRSEIDIALVGERATADLGGVFVARGTQVSDIHTLVSHQARGVISRQNYRGLAADDARGVFHGQIRVDALARGADAVQNNRNMLLSKRAQVYSTPALEILTDDVKCKHGSATGQIDQAQLFYLRSRGIDLKDATLMLTRAFAGEILSRVTAAETRELVEGQIAPSLEALGVAA